MELFSYLFYWMLVKIKDIESQISKVCKVNDLNELKTTVTSDFSTQGNVNWGKEIESHYFYIVIMLLFLSRL